jgi:hypothetical protein
LQPTGTYNSVKNSIRLRKAELNSKKNGHDSLFLNAKALFENSIVNELIPFWYGTEWDFNGYTEIPKKGYIACGYLVSTVLLHCGLSINRYLLAQQSPISEALSIQMNDSVQIYYSGTEDFITTFKANNPEGLYFVGLDNHVGFLLYRSKELYFIHSSYLVPLCVQVKNYDSKKSNAIDYGFKILSEIGSLTSNQWSVIYDINNKKIYFKSSLNKETRTLVMNDFNFSCKNPIKMLDIQTSNTKEKIGSQFFDFSTDYYRKYQKNLHKYLKDNFPEFPEIPADFFEMIVNYPLTSECKGK